MQYKSRYRYETISTTGFIQQLVRYLTSGYLFYVTGTIPEGKDPEAIDRKLLKKYDIAISKWSKSRRKKNGQANVHYLRYKRFYVLLATHGYHKFFNSIHDGGESQKVLDEFGFEQEIRIQDTREIGIRFAGHDISYRQGNRRRMTEDEKKQKREKGPGVEVAKPDFKWHVRVKIESDTYKNLKAHMEELCTQRDEKTLGDMVGNLSFEPYARVRQQLFNLVRLMNEKRRRAGLPKVAWTCVRTRRRSVKPFGDWEESLKRAA